METDADAQSQRERAALTAAMDRYADGDAAAFAAVYDALAPRLRPFLCRLAGSRGDDLLQQTFLQLHCARQAFARGSDVVPWAFAIARRLAIDAQRRSGREVLEAEPPAQEATGDARPDEVAAAREAAAHAEQVLTRIPAAQREAWQLVRRDGLSVAQAAEVLGTTKAAVKLRTFRASEALRAVLGPVQWEEAK